METERTEETEVYEPPMVEDLDTSLGPAATAPGVIVSGIPSRSAPRDL
jgi:hypothetical protein